MSKTGTGLPDLDNKAKVTLGLLNMVHEDFQVSQRSIAKDLGIALGLANAYLRRCVKKGLIKVSQAPANRYAYYLTPMGFAEKSRLTAEFLSQSFNLFRMARSEGALIFGHCQNQGWNRVALYGVSDLTEILSLSARDFSLQIVAVVNDGEAMADIAGISVVPNISVLENIDAVIICDFIQPQAALEKVSAHFLPERILAPKFLGISKNLVIDDGERT